MNETPEMLLCGQCGEQPAAMVKVGTNDGWCVTCLDEAAEPLPVVWPTGRDLIAAERRRQVETEGWTEEHDREHGPQMLAAAGHAYWRNDYGYWPWHRDWWKPKSQFRNLVRAGALYTAALDITASNAVPGRPYYESLIQFVAGDIDELLAEVRAVCEATP